MRTVIQSSFGNYEFRRFFFCVNIPDVDIVLHPRSARQEIEDAINGLPPRLQEFIRGLWDNRLGGYTDFVSDVSLISHPESRIVTLYIRFNTGGCWTDQMEQNVVNTFADAIGQPAPLGADVQYGRLGSGYGFDDSAQHLNDASTALRKWLLGVSHPRLAEKEKVTS